MKKMILSAFAALLLAVPAVQAQKVNKAALLSKIEKCDAEAADAKKAGKAVTWLNRGKAYYEAVTAPTKDIFGNMETTMLTLSLGAPKEQSVETLGNRSYETYVYPYFTAYVSDGRVVAWKETSKVVKNGVDKAFESYAKAYELDPKSAPKVKEGIEQLINYCAQLGDVNYTTQHFAEAGEAFAKCYEMGLNPAVNNKDAQMLYNAGISMTIDGGKDHPESFAKGAEYLQKAIDAGYTDSEGNIYYYLFHCYYGQRESKPEMLLEAKNVLLAGIEKYPKNEQILNSLTQLYTSEEGVGDPNDLIVLFDNALAADPTNTDLWFGRGRTFYAMKNFDESIASFQKVTELKPDMFEGYYYLGLFYILKGDDANQKFNEKTYTRQADYDAGLAEVNAIYLEALPVLEKAHELKPQDRDTVNNLKQLCFRLRDEEGVMEKYNKYNAILSQMND